MKISRLLAALLLLACAFTAQADTINPPTGHVNDRANLLSDAKKKELEQTLTAFKQQTSNELAVVTITSLEGRDIEGYANELFNSWGIGDKERNNGVLLLIAQKEREMRIEVGRGLEGGLPDIICGQIIRNEITPLFKESKFDEGVTKGIAAIMAATKGEYTAKESEKGFEMPWWGWVIIIIIVIILLIISPPSNSSGSGGSSYYSSSGGGSSGGGGSSFGGGSSGGGGASGKW